MEEKDKIKINLKILILLVIVIIAIVITVIMIFYNNFQRNSTDLAQITNTQNNSNKKYTKDLSKYSYYELVDMKDAGEEIDESELKKAFKRDFNKDENTIHYDLMKKYNYNEEIFLKYYFESVEWGDVPNYLIKECNYGDKLGKYNEPIVYKMAMIKDYLYQAPYDGPVIDAEELKLMEMKLLQEKRQWAEASGDESYATEEVYETLNGISIKNGNCKSKKAYENNSRVKKLKITINDTEKHIIELEDTMEVQLFDINYRQDDITKPMIVKFEVLETYEGLVSNDVYIHEIGFGADSYGFGGR